jgi:hypothetical protein
VLQWVQSEIDAAKWHFPQEDATLQDVRDSTKMGTALAKQARPFLGLASGE